MMKTMKTPLTLLMFFVLLCVRAFAEDDQLSADSNDSSRFHFENYHGSVLEYGGDIRCVAYHPNGEILASSGTKDNLIHLFNPQTYESLGSLEGHDGDVNSIAFSSDGTWIASGGDDGTLRLWKDADNNFKWEEKQVFSFDVTILWIVVNPFTNDVTSVAFGKDNTLACGTKADKVFVWRYVEGEDKWVKRIKLEPGHGEDVKSIAFSPMFDRNGDGSKDAMLLASVSNDRTLRLWDLKKMVELWEEIRLEDWGQKGQDLHDAHLAILEYSAPLTSVAFNNVGKLLTRDTKCDLATGSEDRRVILWDIFRSDSDGTSLDGTYQEREGHTGAVRGVAFSPDGKVLVTAGDDQTISIWDGQTGDLYDWRRVHDHGITSVAVTRGPPPEGPRESDGPMLMATGSIDGRVLCIQHTPLIHLTSKGFSVTLEEDLFTSVAYGTDTIEKKPATYFVFRAKFPTEVKGVKTDDVFWDSCKITLDIPSQDVPARPVDNPDPNNDRLKNPGYFMYPIKTPADRLVDVDRKYGFFKLGWRSVGEKFGAAGSGALVGMSTGNPIAGAAIGFTVAIISDVLKQNQRYNAEVREILEATADPSFVLTPVGGARPTDEFPLLFLVPDKITYVDLKIELKFRQWSDDLSNIYLVKYEERKELNSIVPAAPGTQPMTLSDYPPFQTLPSEVQAYLLRYFLGGMNTQTWRIPERTALLPNYPNPFNPETWLPYQLSKPADVTLTIYDIQGRVVRDLDLGHQRAGLYHSRSRAAYWDGRNAHGESVASGIYFYTLKAGDFAATRKLLIRK